MTILGRGDLSPRRRHHRRGRRILVSFLLIAVLAGGGYLGWRYFHDDSSPPARLTAAPCVTQTPSPAPLAAAKVAVVVLNTTPRVGLAHDVGDQLSKRGFHVTRVGNTSRSVTGVGAVFYGPGQLAAATTVAEQLPGRLAPTPVARPGVELDLGSTFARLATPAEVAVQHQADLVASSPRPPSCPPTG